MQWAPQPSQAWLPDDTVSCSSLVTWIARPVLTGLPGNLPPTNCLHSTFPPTTIWRNSQVLAFMQAVPACNKGHGTSSRSATHNAQVINTLPMHRSSATQVPQGAACQALCASVMTHNQLKCCTCLHPGVVLCGQSSATVQPGPANMQPERPVRHPHSVQDVGGRNSRRCVPQMAAPLTKAVHQTSTHCSPQPLETDLSTQVQGSWGQPLTTRGTCCPAAHHFHQLQPTQAARCPDIHCLAQQRD